jgi:hypothetical protein
VDFSRRVTVVSVWAAIRELRQLKLWQEPSDEIQTEQEAEPLM